MTIIHTSPKKALRALLVSCVTLALSVYLVYSSKLFQAGPEQSSGLPVFIQLFIALLGFAFFARAVYVLLPLVLQGKKPFIRVDEEGITDLFSKEGRTVRWADVTDIKTAGRKSNPVVLVFLKDPKRHIDSAPGSFRKRIGNMRLKKYGTPVMIENRLLETTADSLIGILQLYRPDNNRFVQGD